MKIVSASTLLLSLGVLVIGNPIGNVTTTLHTRAAPGKCGSQYIFADETQSRVLINYRKLKVTSTITIKLRMLMGKFFRARYLETGSRIPMPMGKRASSTKYSYAQ